MSCEVAVSATTRTKSKHTVTMNESKIVIPDGAEPFKAGIGFKDISEQKFGKLFPVKPVYRFKGRLYWECKCECGSTAVIWGVAIRTGETKSCGCMKNKGRIELGAPVKTFPEYGVWTGMIQRCHNPNDLSFHRYGGRGIMVSNEWRSSFARFYNDMGPRPHGHTLERKNNDGNYCKDNCKWATPKEQAQNTSRAVFLEINGEVKRLSEWLRHFGIKKATYSSRVKLGWDKVKAASAPLAREVGIAESPKVQEWAADSVRAMGRAKA